MCDGRRASAAVIQDERKASARRRRRRRWTRPPRGTRDFYPHSCATSDAEDMSLRTWLFGHWRAVAGLHGFEEYDAPVLESEELYVRKAGEDVTKQLYSMEDQSGRKLALRPEMTPSLARMVLARRGGMNLPVKWFSIPQCWRYERMTRGRRREHYQWNLDVWGVDGVAAEAELLAAAAGFCERVGLTAADVGVKVSTRGVLAELLGGGRRPSASPPSPSSSTTRQAARGGVRSLLGEQGLGATWSTRCALAVRDFDALAGALGAESAALAELRSCGNWRRRTATPTGSCSTRPSCAASRTTPGSSSRASTARASCAPSSAAGGTTSCSRRSAPTTSPPPASASATPSSSSC